MNKKIEKLKQFRLFILQQIADLTTERVNIIPTGFNNNIIWNLGHMLSTSQVICYKRAGLSAVIDEQYIAPFLTNTKPDHFVAGEEIEVIKGLLISTMDTLKTDIEKGIFGNYTKSERIEAVYGVKILTIEDAIEFLLYHEGVHSGYIVGLKKLVQE